MTFKRFTAPKIATVPTRRITIPFNINTGGVIGEHTFVAGPIPFPFVVEEIRLYCEDWFASGQHYYFLLSRTNNVGTVGPPPDYDMLSYGGCDNPLTGPWREDKLVVKPNLVALESRLFLKVHISDLTGNFSQVQAFITIREYKEVNA